MTSDDDYAVSTAVGLAEALANRRIGAVELFEAAVAAIQAKDRPINAVVVRDFDRARDAAKAADAALSRGDRRPLLGVPMTVKESHHIAGLPTTWGLVPFKGWTPSWDSTGVARLKAAGAVILGKTNIPTSLDDWQSANPIYGRTNNPLDLTRTPGGSSGGGAAAVASGMVPLEFGSDLGGSIRVPAHFCGVYGHKPSFGLIPQTGHAPPGIAAPSTGIEVGVLGPLARSVGDLELALDVLAGPEGEMAKGYRLALPHRVLDGYPICACWSSTIIRWRAWTPRCRACCMVWLTQWAVPGQGCSSRHGHGSAGFQRRARRLPGHPGGNHKPHGARPE